MDPDAGRYFELRQRLRKSLAQHHWERGKPFSPLQEDAWLLLNEVEEVIKTLERVAKVLPEDGPQDLVRTIRHTLAMHQPHWKNKEG